MLIAFCMIVFFVRFCFCVLNRNSHECMSKIKEVNI